MTIGNLESPLLLSMGTNQNGHDLSLGFDSLDKFPVGLFRVKPFDLGRTMRQLVDGSRSTTA